MFSNKLKSDQLTMMHRSFNFERAFESRRTGPLGLVLVRTGARRQVAQCLRVLLGLLLIGQLVAMPADLSAQDDKTIEDLTIGEREAFDRLTFNEANEDAVLEVFPLELPGGVVPETPPPGEWLRFRLVDRPQHLFETPWTALVKVERYPDLLLQEAQGLIAAQEFDKAFPALSRLMRDYPETKGLQQMQVEFLYQNARQLIQRGNGYAALTVLDELNRLNADYRPSNSAPQAGEMVEQVLNEILGGYVNNREFTRAERYMEIILGKYGEQQRPVVDRWQKEIENVALKYMADAKTYLASGDGRAAHQAVRRMFGILREVEGGEDIASQVLEKFPLVLVAVPQTSLTPNPNSLNNWASRRLGRLSYRTMVEYAGQGQDGGVYVLPQGSIEMSEDRKSIVFEISETPTSPLLPETSIYQLSKRFFEAADVNREDSIPAWSRLLAGLEIESENRLRVDLRFPHVLPESYLKLPFQSKASEDTEQPNGVYRPHESLRGNQEKRFMVNDAFRDKVDKNWPEIVEQVFTSHEEAVQALERSDIDVIEQVFPADVPRLRENPDVVVDRYELPVTHILIPNPRNALMKFPAFRRALLYGTNRELILQQMILGGAPLEGAELISGPFPLGIDDSDPLNYAYNFRIEPIPYEKRLGQTLVKLAEIQLQDQLELERIERGEATAVEEGEPEPIKIKLVYPAGDIPSIACQAMAKQLKSIGLEMELVQLDPGEVYPADDDWDLLFTEVIMSEPLADARRLMAEDGLAQIKMAPIDLALRRLDEAESWSQARRRLYELHLLAFNEVAILPLWQLPVYHARRNSLRGVGSNLQTLYDQVDAWELVIYGRED